MATIEKRTTSDNKASYRVKIRLKGKPSISATFERLTDAKAWVQKTESAIREGRYFNHVGKNRTLRELIEKYEREIIPHKNYKANYQHHLDFWKNELGDYHIKDVTAALIGETRASLIGRKNQFKRTIGASTANRYTSALSHVFSIAVNEFEWVEANPVHKLSKLKEPRGRVRSLSDSERKSLLEACGESQNPFLYAITVFALSTGARKSEITALKWEDVNLRKGQVTFHETKNGERRSAPLRGLALEMIKTLEEQKGDNIYLFQSPNSAAPVDIRSAWENAVKNAGLEDFRFHDLRHSAASYLAMNSATLTDIAEVLGHKTLQMVKRYAHLTDAHTSSVVESMNKKVFG